MLRSIPAATLASVAALVVASPAPAAYTWTAPETVMACCGVGAPAYAATDSAGDALIVLADARLLERPRGGAWSAPVRVGTPGRLTAWVDGDLASSGAAAAVWVENRRQAYQRVRAVVRRAGARFSTALRVTPDMGAGARRAQIAVDDDGNALAVWEAGARRSYERGHVEASYRPAGGAFGRPRVISGEGASPPAVDLSPDGDGVIAWTRGTRIEAVGVKRGKLGAVKLIGTTGSASPGPNAFAPASPALAVGPDGAAVIAWAAALPGRDPGVDADEDTRARGVRVSSRPRKGVFGPPSLVRTLRPRDGQLGPITAAAGPSGRALVAWQEIRYDVNDDHNLGLNSIFSTLRGAYSRGHGRFGAYAALSPSDQPGYVGDPSVAFGAGGELAVAWSWYLDSARSGLQVGSGRGGAITSTRTISAPLPLDWGVQNMSPRVSIDAGGTATAFWRQQIQVSPADGGHYGDVLQTATGAPGA